MEGGKNVKADICSSNDTVSSPTAPSTQTSGTSHLCFGASTTTLAAGSVAAECPSIPEGRVNYTVPGTNLRFMRVCGADYMGDDLARVPTPTMQDCLALCAYLNLRPASALGRCTGVSWVYADGPQGLGSSFCYPKTNLREKKDREWIESAVLVD
jgi:hypothetical protein